MGETNVRWIAWARGMRRRWTCRRETRVPLDLVWLRPLALRLSIAPSITLHWASRILALADHVRMARERHTLTTLIVRSLDALRIVVARPSHGAPRDSTSEDENRFGSWRSVLRPVAAPLSLRTSRRVGVRGCPMPLRRPIEAHATRRWARVSTETGRFATASTSGRSRIEPLVVPPPPMVGRTPTRTIASHASQARPDIHDLHSPFGIAIGERSGWMPATGALTDALSPAVLASVTDHVVREIDGRVRAKRERLGKV